MHELLPVAVLTGLVAIWYELFEAMGVGTFRKAYDVPPPRTDGPPLLMRAFRSHQNQVEQLVVFFPALWVHAVFVSPVSAAVVGSLWFALRIAYGFAYRTMAKEEPTLVIFTIPCYHLLGILALGPLGVMAVEVFEAQWWIGILAGVVAWFAVFFAAVGCHRSYLPFIEEERAKAR